MSKRDSFRPRATVLCKTIALLFLLFLSMGAPQELGALTKKLSYEQLQTKVAALDKEKKLFSKEGEITVEQLALAHEKKGTYNKATTEFLRLWSIRKVLYGNDKAVTLHALYGLARSYSYEERTFDTALELLHRIVKKAQNQKAEFVQKIKGAAFAKMAQIFIHRKKYAEAAVLQQLSLDVFTAFTGAEESLGLSYISSVPIFARVEMAQAKSTYLKGLAILEQRSKGRGYFLACYYAYSYADFSKKRGLWSWLATGTAEVPKDLAREGERARAFVKRNSAKLGKIMRRMQSRPAESSGKISTSNALVESLEDGDCQQAKILVNSGQPITVVDELGATPLLLACEQGDKELIELLLEKGASMNEIDRLEEGVFHYLAKGLYLDMFKGAYRRKLKRPPLEIDRLAIIQMLLRKKTNDSAGGRAAVSSDRTAADISSNIATLFSKDLLRYEAIHFASYDTKGEVANYLINAAVNVNVTNELQRTPLHYAARDGNGRVIAMLLAKGAKVRQVDIIGYTPLHLAVINNHLSIVKQLMESTKSEVETDGKLSGLEGGRSRSPIELAKKFGHKEIYSLLKEYSKKHRDLKSPEEDLQTKEVGK